MSERPASAEAAIELYLELRRRGEAHDPATFAAQYPELGPELAPALDAMLALERITSEPPSTELATPERVGAFRVVREIGRGGMGVVLEAIEEPLGRRVALKVLPPELVSSASARARFRREAELAARLDHSGIATVYGAGVQDERPWIAMRYVEGETLAHAIAEARTSDASCVRLSRNVLRGRDAALAVAACLAKVARALQCAHEQGVLHRDVKPSNIIVASDGAPILLDFGLAIAEESDGRSLTRTGETAGTPAYLSPESLSGEIVRPDAQSDVYALGVTLYECLALKKPFDAPTRAALYRAILLGAAADLCALNRAVPRDLAVVAATAMERDRARRYRNAAALADDLEACVAGRPIAARPVPLLGRITRWARREPRQALLASLLVGATLVVGILGGSWWRARDEVHAAEHLTNAERFEHALQRGYMHLAENWKPEAEAAFVEALAIEPGNPEAIAGRAFVRLKYHRDAEALAVLADAPSTPAFDALRAMASGGSPDAEHGKAWFGTASATEMFVDGWRLKRQAERSPKHERRHLQELELARFEEAVKRSETPRMMYQIERASAAEDLGDEPAIRSAAAALIVLWPKQARAYFTAGAALSQIDPLDAIPLLERAVELEPTFEPHYQVLGNARVWAEDYEGAASALGRAIELDPNDADALNSLGYVYAKLGCDAEAREAYRSAIALRPLYFEAWANLALLDSKNGGTAAEDELRFALSLDPWESQLRLPLADLLRRRGEARDAIAEIDTVVGFDASNVAAWKQLAACALDLHDPALAASAAGAGLAIAPGDAELSAIVKDTRETTADGR